MRILVVEDDMNSSKLMVHFLRRFGTCDTATDGVEAVAAVTESYRTGSPYNLLILDIMMPNLGGMETLKAIRTHEEGLGIPYEDHVKAIMVSALSGDTIRTEAYQKGCTAYIRKPIDFHQLERVIRDELLLQEDNVL